MKLLEVEEKQKERILKLYDRVKNAIEIYTSEMEQYFKRKPDLYRAIPEELRPIIFKEIPNFILYIMFKCDFREENIEKIKEYADTFIKFNIPADVISFLMSLIFKTAMGIIITAGNIKVSEVPYFSEVFSNSLNTIWTIFTERAISQIVDAKMKMKETEILKELLKELSVPILQIWDKILLVPLIGMMTSDRAKEAMEKILKAAEDTDSSIVIIDITGVPIIDTMVADVLIKICMALSILGNKTIITGIKADIAKTLVGLGIDVEKLTTFRTLKEGLMFAIKTLEEK